MVALDLERIRKAVEPFLMDTVQAKAGPLDPTEADFDEEIGEYTAASPTAIYEGPGAISGRSSGSNYGGLTVAGTPDGDYQVMVPIAAPQFPIGTEVTAPNARDLRLRDRKFAVIDDGTVGTYAVLRTYSLAEVLPGQEVTGG